MRLGLLLALGLAACTGEPTPEPAPQPDADRAADLATDPAAAPVVSSEAGASGRSSASATARPGADESSAALGQPLSFAPGDDWIETPPSSSMRHSQYRLPSSGTSVAAELVVYYFGAGQGGSVEANVERWATQFTQPDGSDTLEGVGLSERRVQGLPVHEVSIGGTYVAETSPGSGERVNHSNWRMLAAIVESDHGPYYVKLTGPADEVALRAGEFRNFVSELH